MNGFKQSIKQPESSNLRLHVKIPENYFKILEEGKNVGKFLFRRNVKMSENVLANVQKCRKMDQNVFWN